MVKFYYVFFIFRVVGGMIKVFMEFFFKNWVIYSFLVSDLDYWVWLILLYIEYELILENIFFYIRLLE